MVEPSTGPHGLSTVADFDGQRAGMPEDRRLDRACPALDEWLRREPPDRRLWLADLREGLRSHPARVIHPPLVPSRDAAVLLPVDEDSTAGLQVVLIERAADIGTHRGDIAFPGGGVERSETHSAAALREAEEEIGISASAVEIIAELSTHPIIEGYVIWPFVGILRHLRDPGHRSCEVERVIVVPLADLVTDGAWWRESWPTDPTVVLDYFAVPGGTAWGTSGSLLRELLEICISGRLALHSKGFGP